MPRLLGSREKRTIFGSDPRVSAKFTPVRTRVCTTLIPAIGTLGRTPHTLPVRFVSLVCHLIPCPCVCCIWYYIRTIPGHLVRLVRHSIPYQRCYPYQKHPCIQHRPLATVVTCNFDRGWVSSRMQRCKATDFRFFSFLCKK